MTGSKKEVVEDPDAARKKRSSMGTAIEPVKNRLTQAKLSNPKLRGILIESLSSIERARFESFHLKLEMRKVFSVGEAV